MWILKQTISKLNAMLGYAVPPLETACTVVLDSLLICTITSLVAPTASCWSSIGLSSYCLASIGSSSIGSASSEGASTVGTGTG